MSVLADMDADKKVAVLKKAILAITKQKQDIEAARVALEVKVGTLVEELGKAEERNESLAAKNRELVAEVERLQANKGGLSAVPGAAARSLLGTLGTFGSAPKDGGIGVEQQRLFEENEALHIQIFEQKTDYERRIKAMEAAKAESAMKVHSLEGLLASIQASDVAQSQQATEARRELAIEKGYSNYCQYALFYGQQRPIHAAHTSGGGDGEEEAVQTLDGFSTSDATAAIGIVLKRCFEVIQHSMSGVSALLPHTLATSASTLGASAAGQLTQDAHRQRTVIAAHREFRNRINETCARLAVDGEGEENGAAAYGLGDERQVSGLLASLLSETSAWLNLLHNNAGLLFGPIEPLHAGRCRSILRPSSEGTPQQVRSLEQQFQAVVAELIGGLKVLRDGLRGAGVVGSPKDGEPKLANVPFSLKLIGAFLSYRTQCATSDSSSYSGKLSIERLLFNIEAAANYQDGDTTPLPTHYYTPLTQMIATLKETSRQWTTAFGDLAVFAGFSSSTTHDKAPHTSKKSYGVLAKRMAQYFAMPLVRKSESHMGLDDLAAAERGSSVGSQDGPSANIPSASQFAAFEAEVISQLKAADCNATHCYAISQRAMLELAHCHDRIEALTAKATAVEGDNVRMKKEYVSVVEVYESQIRLLSEHLAEVAQEGSVTRNGRKN